MAQQEIHLYPGKIPNAKAVKNEQQQTANALVDSLTANISVPSLSIYLPDQSQSSFLDIIKTKFLLHFLKCGLEFLCPHRSLQDTNTIIDADL